MYLVVLLLTDTAHSHTLRKVEEVVLMVLLLEDTATDVVCDLPLQSYLIVLLAEDTARRHCKWMVFISWDYIIPGSIITCRYSLDTAMWKMWLVSFLTFKYSRRG